MMKEFKSFSEFYPYYLSEHSDNSNRRLHIAGCFIVVIIVLYSILSSSWIYLLAVPFVGYGTAWTGHFFFEKNKPATFEYPVYSLMGDWVMFWDILSGKLRF